MPTSTPQRTPSEATRIAALAARLRRRRDAAQLPRKIWLASLLLFAAVAVSFVWPFAKAHLQAVAVLDLVGNQPVPTLLHKLVTEPITTYGVNLNTSQGTVRARLYSPLHHPNAPALVVLHGVHHLGMDEPRLIAFASAMASCGLRVLTPELPDIKDYHVGANSIATIGDTATWLARQNGGRPVGVMGLSFSGGLSLLAASDPKFRPSIKFVVAIGSQDAMSRVAQYYRTGRDLRPDGSEEVLPPHEYGALVMEYENLQDFAPTADLTPLRAVLRAHLYEDSVAEKAALAALTPAQLAEVKQLMDTTSAATRDKLAAAETKHIEDMAGVSPHGHLRQLTTPVYLLHGEGDNIIPAAETLWMASELPSETLKASLISPVLTHIDIDKHGPTAMDRWRLVHFFALILHATEAK
ncbi:MAG TPA: alpha/beta hydrolase [Granulicella sp.]|jgi:pimeloyl-ACP methyl ester carboxylesterase